MKKISEFNASIDVKSIVTFLFPLGEILITSTFFLSLTIFFNSSIFDDNEVIKQATLKMGHQAIVGYIPFILKKNTIKIYHSKRNKFRNS